MFGLTQIERAKLMAAHRGALAANALGMLNAPERPGEDEGLRHSVRRLVEAIHEFDARYAPGGAS